MFKRILVAVDGSPTADEALAVALQLARQNEASVRLVHSFDALVYLTGFEILPEVLDEARQFAQKVLDEGLQRAAASHVQADSRLLDTPGRNLGEQVADAATAFGADLVVVGTHGRRGIRRMALGSGAEQVLRCAPVPVLAVRGT